MKLIIADDEPLARRRLRDLIGDLGGHEILGEASDGKVLCELSAELQPDAVVIDIAMPVLDGLEAARHLARLSHPPAVVFCTAYDEHALAAFDAHAVDYVVKPIRAERLGVALERAQRFTGERADKLVRHLPGNTSHRSHLSSRLRGSLKLIPIDTIRFLQAEEKYVVVHHAHGQDLVEDSLKALEAEFGERFIRVHRSCLVAASEPHELTRDAQGNDILKLRNDPTPIEISRRCLPVLRRRMKHL